MPRRPLFLLPLALATACTGGSGVPADLEAIEGDAEHAYDVALVSDFAELATTADGIDSAWAAYRDTASADGASAALLDEMDVAVAGLLDVSGGSPTAVEAARAANAVSAPMPELYRLYDPPIPPEVLALDYLGREVVLDAMDDDFGAAVVDVDTVATTWAGLEPTVLDAGGDAEAADFSASVARMQELAQGTDAQALIDEANVNLELVDVLEGLF
ncbi:MAG: hypothetical protein H6742_04900 [Alphaproteobacteria bacterium]|nr:hypothetical protein [Alphaproteobacteria bacterium]